MVTAREVCFLLATGRVVELMLDHDLNGDTIYGQSKQVVDYLVEQAAVNDRALWPRDSLSIRLANAAGRDTMVQAIETQTPRFVSVERTSPGGQRHFEFGGPG
jgi:hypothetical protein